MGRKFRPTFFGVVLRPVLCILSGHFMVIEQTLAIPKDRAGSAAYMQAFIEALKASGFVAEALTASGQQDAAVAPAAP